MLPSALVSGLQRLVGRRRVVFGTAELSQRRFPARRAPQSREHGNAIVIIDDSRGARVYPAARDGALECA